MKKYLIKREIEGASQIPQEKLSQIGEGSESVLVKMRSEGKEIEQEQRRKRDSNPRRCDPQQFSRLPHSTTLPFLLAGANIQTKTEQRKLFQ